MAEVSQTQVLEDLSFLLGESSVPTSGIEDRKRFIQRALERVYRIYDFPMNKLEDTITVSDGVADLPSDMAQNSPLDVRDSDGDEYLQVQYEEKDRYAQGSRVYWLTGFEGEYVLNTHEADGTLYVRYSSSVPTISATIKTPFPSSMTLARGALIYYRQAEDPQADISQEEAIFQQELDEIIAQHRRNTRRRTPRTQRDLHNTYIGDIGGY